VNKSDKKFGFVVSFVVKDFFLQLVVGKLYMI
jgi:hypothetical protein